MSTLHVCFFWHMHQPPYADPRTGEVIMPWVRLHGVKDYTDMAAAVEAVPGARVTVNWVPCLLDQLDALRDPGYPQRETFWRLSLRPAHQLDQEDRHVLREHFFSLDEERMLEPWPRYRELRDRARAGNHLDLEELRDLQVWFNLAWCGAVARQHPAVQALLARERDFTEADKQALMEAQREICSQVTPRWRALAASGRAELTCSPYYHPILPLLIDGAFAHEADPATPTPANPFRHPADARVQLARALDAHEARFGQRPQGVWPSEGSVAAPVIDLARDLGVRWLVSDEAILHKSLGRHVDAPGERLGPWDAGGVALWFRDHDLSDRIGFVYAGWSEEAAHRDMVARLRELHGRLDGDGAVVIALDGENCWETYRGGSLGFLPGLYDAIHAAKGLRLSTLSEALDAVGTHGRRLPHVAPGSWIDGTFRTWIGHPAKNQAWEVLTDARDTVARPLDQVLAEDPELADLVMRAEASDWWWWLGEGHSSSFDHVFDRLFRSHVQAIWERLGLDPPAALEQPIDPAAFGRLARTLRAPVARVRPTITGRRDSYYKWAGCGEIRPQYGAIHRATTALGRVLFGFDADALSLRVDMSEPAPHLLEGGRRLRLVVAEPRRAEVLVWPPADGVAAASVSVVEARVPVSMVGVTPDEDASFAFRVQLEEADGQVLERLPVEGFAVVRPDVERLACYNWLV